MHRLRQPLWDPGYGSSGSQQAALIPAAALAALAAALVLCVRCSAATRFAV